MERAIENTEETFVEAVEVEDLIEFSEFDLKSWNSGAGDSSCWICLASTCPLRVVSLLEKFVVRGTSRASGTPNGGSSVRSRSFSPSNCIRLSALRILLWEQSWDAVSESGGTKKFLKSMLIRGSGRRSEGMVNEMVSAIIAVIGSNMG